jgi:hypothetical protein
MVQDFLSESNTELHVIQPPVRDHMSCSSGRKASGPGPAGGSGSVDIPSCQPVAATSPACHLPHQSQSLPPLIPRLMRTQSTSSSGGEQPAEQPPSKVSGSISRQQNVTIQFGPPAGWAGQFQVKSKNRCHRKTVAKCFLLQFCLLCHSINEPFEFTRRPSAL